jgi:hypothetical protein
LDGAANASFLLKEFGFSPSVLLSAVRVGNVKTVASILGKIESTELVNRFYPDGTLLTVASGLAKLETIERLLLVPAIDPSLPDSDQ